MVALFGIQAEKLKVVYDTELYSNNLFQPIAPPIQSGLFFLHGIDTAKGGREKLSRANSFNLGRVMDQYIPNSSFVVIQGESYRIKRSNGSLELVRPDNSSSHSIATLVTNDDGVTTIDPHSFNRSILEQADWAGVIPAGSWSTDSPSDVDIQITDMRYGRPLLGLNDLEDRFGSIGATKFRRQMARGVGWLQKNDSQGTAFMGVCESGGALGEVKRDNGTVRLVEPRTVQSLMRLHPHVFTNQHLASLDRNEIVQWRARQPWDGLSHTMSAQAANELRDWFQDKGGELSASIEYDPLGVSLFFPNGRPDILTNPYFLEFWKNLSLIMHHELVDFWGRHLANVSYDELIRRVQGYHQSGVDFDEYEWLTQLKPFSDSEEDARLASLKKTDNLNVPGGWAGLCRFEPDGLFITTAFILINGVLVPTVNRTFGFGAVETYMTLLDRKLEPLPQELNEGKTEHIEHATKYLLQ